MIKRTFFQSSILCAAMLAAKTPQSAAEIMAKEIRHELVMLPYYNVFDNLAYRVDGEKVTLFGQVTRPSLKSDAERAAKKVEGVASVDNEIEVLPLSPNDERIRMAVYRAIYSRGPLQRYRLNTVLPIHIIVQNGNITLEGVVANPGDRHLAGIAANGVNGAFTLKNNLEVEKALQDSFPEK
jgi:hyperosmotically inducible protein